MAAAKKQEEESEQAPEEACRKATAARAEARKLQGLPHVIRQCILRSMADALLERQEELLAANVKDLVAAEKERLDIVLKKQLGLTQAKLAALALGLRQLADLADP